MLNVVGSKRRLAGGSCTVAMIWVQRTLLVIDKPTQKPTWLLAMTSQELADTRPVLPISLSGSHPMTDITHPHVQGTNRTNHYTLPAHLAGALYIHFIVTSYRKYVSPMHYYIDNISCDSCHVTYHRCNSASVDTLLVTNQGKNNNMLQWPFDWAKVTSK